MGWCKGNFAACVRFNTPSRQVTHMRVMFDGCNMSRILSDGVDYVSVIISLTMPIFCGVIAITHTLEAHSAEPETPRP